jgi:F0F1-type ATP synthase assembly protein I
MVRVGEHLAHGLTIAAAAGLFAAGGYYLDRWLGTSPIFLLCGTLVGAAAGFLKMYWSLVVEPRQRARRESEGSGGST